MKNTFYTLTEVSSGLKVSEKTIMEAVRKGNLKGIKIASLWRFSDDQIDDYISMRTVCRNQKKKWVPIQSSIMKKYYPDEADYNFFDDDSFIDKQPADTEDKITIPMNQPMKPGTYGAAVVAAHFTLKSTNHDNNTHRSTIG